jgi:N utilization substance protein B
MTDYRHERRQKFFQQIFAGTFTVANTQTALSDATNPTLVKLLNSIPDLDAEIQTAAPERPLKDINKVDLAILRMTIFESREKKTPKKVLINEAIELAKEFGSESSPKFINGALAKLLLDPQTENE